MPDPIDPNTPEDERLSESQKPTAPIPQDPEGTGDEFFQGVHKPDPVPERIGPYRVVGELGRGGMGVVFAAIRDDDQFRRRVAIKVVKRGMDTDEILRRFEQERQVLAAMNHPNIARLLDGGSTEDGRPYFVMEFVEGQRLDHYCDTHHLTVSERLELFAHVCRGVQYAHQNLIVHRDLKPANIIVTKDGEPKLLDFGIAKVINPDIAHLALDPTGTEFRLMTPEYASPEQARGDPLSTSSDVYSLGVILYELVTGHRPYQLKSRIIEEVKRVICQVDPERPSTAIDKTAEMPVGLAVGTAGDTTGDGSSVTVTPEAVSRTREGRPERLRRRLRGDIDNIIMRAMEKAPQRRYATAEQLAEDIGRHLDGMPVTARPPSAGYRFGKFVRRNRAGVVMAALALAAVIGVLATGWFLQAAATERERADAADARTEVERVRADSEQARADDRVASLRELVRTFLYDVYDEMPRVEGTTLVRLTLAEEGRKHLEALEADVGDDANFRAEIADAYERLGEIQGGLAGTNLGMSKAAQRDLTRAADIRRAMVGESPDDTALRLELAYTLVRLAQVMREHDVIGSQAVSQEILALVEVGETFTPEDAKAWKLISSAMITDGDALRNENEFVAALARYDNALRMREQVDRRINTDRVRELDPRRALGVAYGKRADALAALDRRDEAEHGYTRNLEIRRELHELAPDHPTLRRDRYTACYKFAAFLSNAEPPRVDEATVLLDEGEPIIMQLREADPADVRAMRDVAQLQVLRSNIARLAGRNDEAVEAAARGVTHARDLLAAQPDNVACEFILGTAHLAAGRAQLASGATTAARSAFNESQLRFQAASDADPANFRYFEMVAEAKKELRELDERDEG